MAAFPILEMHDCSWVPNKNWIWEEPGTHRLSTSYDKTSINVFLNFSLFPCRSTIKKKKKIYLRFKHPTFFLMFLTWKKGFWYQNYPNQAIPLIPKAPTFFISCDALYCFAHDWSNCLLSQIFFTRPSVHGPCSIFSKLLYKNYSDYMWALHSFS